MDSIISPDQRPRLLSKKTIGTIAGDSWDSDSLNYWKGGCQRLITTRTEQAVKELGFSSTDSLLKAKEEGVLSENNWQFFAAHYASDLEMQKMHEKVSRVIEETYKCVLCILKLIQQVDRLKKEILSLKENSNE